MEFIRTELCNTTIGRPSDMTDDQCGALPARVWRDDEGPWATSFWKPSQEELNTLIAGGAIGLNLRVGAGQHPVTSMVVYIKEVL